MFINILPSCVYVHHVHAWPCAAGTKEGINFSRTGVRELFELSCGVGNPSQVFCKSSEWF